jgi:hypothetical protein
MTQPNLSHAFTTIPCFENDRQTAWKFVSLHPNCMPAELISEVKLEIIRLCKSWLVGKDRGDC